MTKLVGLDPPSPRVLLRTEVPSKIARLSGKLTVNGVPYWDLRSDRRIDLYDGASDKVLNLLTGQQI